MNESSAFQMTTSEAVLTKKVCDFIQQRTTLSHSLVSLSVSLTHTYTHTHTHPSQFTEWHCPAERCVMEKINGG